MACLDINCCNKPVNNELNDDVVANLIRIDNTIYNKNDLDNAFYLHVKTNILLTMLYIVLTVNKMVIISL